MKSIINEQKKDAEEKVARDIERREARGKEEYEQYRKLAAE